MVHRPADKTLQMLMDLWYSALRAEHGLRIETPDRHFMLNQLYAARQSAVDEELDTLSIVRDAEDENVLWIVRKDAAVSDAPST
jgi:hypothetical protein